MAFSAHRGVNSANYAAAGKAVVKQSASIYDTTRKNSIDFTKLAKTGLENASKERQMGMAAEATVSKAGINAMSEMAGTAIAIESGKRIRKSNEKTRKAGKIAAFSAAASQAFAPPKRPIKPAQHDYSGLIDKYKQRGAQAQQAADSVSMPELNVGKNGTQATAGTASPNTGTNGGSKKIDPKDMSMKYMKYLTGKGMSKTQAAAMVGHLRVETGNFKHMEELAPNRHGTRGYGHLQWTDEKPGVGRRTNFENFAKNNNLAANSFDANSGFLMEELTGRSAGGWTSGSFEEFKGITDMSQASAYLEKNFIRPSAGSSDRRLSEANSVLQQWNSLASMPQQNGGGVISPNKFRVGSTGASTGPHLDFRVYDKSKGGYVSNPGDYSSFITGPNGQKLSDYQVTSPYGMRTHPVHGGQRMHHGIDYGIAEGTALNVQGKFVERKWDQGGGGWMNIYQHPNNPNLEFVLLHGQE